MQVSSKKEFRSRTEVFLQLVFDWVAALVTALAVLVALFIFLFRVVEVDGDSMQTTLYDKDRLILWTVGYQPEQGDIVVVDRYTEDPLIKRVIGLPGDTVEVTEDAVYVNGIRLEEPYVNANFPNVPCGMEVTVPDGHVFVMGDHRNNSSDSRAEHIGCVREENLVGKVIFRFYPFSAIGGVE